jgi:predicted DNA-binding protein with PD1-like motif
MGELHPNPLLRIDGITWYKANGRRHPMRYSQAKQGRTFIIRLEDGEVIHDRIEQFTREHAVQAGALIIVGGADEGSKLVVGPDHGRKDPVVPMEHVLQGVHEIAGTGTLFPDEAGNSVLHMHIACGRKTSTVTGCIRKGVKVWHVMEIILFELVDTSARRVTDSETGFSLLHPS